MFIFQLGLVCPENVYIFMKLIFFSQTIIFGSKIYKLNLIIAEFSI